MIDFKAYKTLEKYNEKELINTYGLDLWYEQNEGIDSYVGMKNRDVQMDGVYENGSFNEPIYCPRNEMYEDSYFVDIPLMASPDTFDKRYVHMGIPTKAIFDWYYQGLNLIANLWMIVINLMMILTYYLM